jgi:hypothetical protein
MSWALVELYLSLNAFYTKLHLQVPAPGFSVPMMEVQNFHFWNPKTPPINTSSVESIYFSAPPLRCKINPSKRIGKGLEKARRFFFTAKLTHPKELENLGEKDLRTWKISKYAFASQTKQ